MMRFLLALLLLAGPLHAEPPAARPILPILTGLPLFWGEGPVGSVLQLLSVRSSLLMEIEGRYLVEAVDTFDADHFAQRQLLLAIQPASLPAEEFVALDAWIRRGGRALIFADPDLVWPTGFAVGDRRRPPASTLLDPLFKHWGLRLVGKRTAPQRVAAEIDGITVTMINPGVWHRSMGGCAVAESGHVATCLLGKGQVILIADADMLDPRLWTESAPDNVRALRALLARLEDEPKTTIEGGPVDAPS